MWLLTHSSTKDNDYVWDFRCPAERPRELIVTTCRCRLFALWLAVPALLTGLPGCAADTPASGPVGATLTVTSTAFAHEGSIPVLYSCDGEDISPPIAWGNVPDGAESFALICDDPDAIGTWVHWVVFNLPGDSAGLPEDVPDGKTLAGGGFHGENSWGDRGYGGPCPPRGSHHYVFTVYALDTMLPLDPGASKRAVLDAISGHVLATGELIGVYPG